LLPSVPENGAYLGIPLVAFAVLAVIFVRRSPLLRFSAVMALLSFVLALGPGLDVDGKPSGLALPFRLLSTLPLVGLEVPDRYMVFCFLFIAVILAIGIDALWRSSTRIAGSSAPSPRAPRRRRLRAVVPALVPVCAVAILLPLIPRWPYQSPIVDTPSYFTNGSARVIPNGSVVLAYPFPMFKQNNAMLWQVDSGFRFSIVGGYVLTPIQKTAPAGGSPGGGIFPQTPSPPIAEIEFETAFYAPTGVSPYPQLAWAFEGMAQFLRNYHVETIVVEPIGARPKVATDFLTAMIGGPQVHSQGVDVWYRVQSHLKRSYKIPGRSKKHRHVRAKVTK
jgi:hypothetical protein